MTAIKRGADHPARARRGLPASTSSANAVAVVAGTTPDARALVALFQALGIRVRMFASIEDALQQARWPTVFVVSRDGRDELYDGTEDHQHMAPLAASLDDSERDLGLLIRDRRVANNGLVVLATPLLVALLTRASNGAVRRRSTRTNDVVLSPRQEEVRNLVAAGFTDRQVAQRLVLSVRTVNRHVSDLLRILGCTSRRQLAEFTQPHSACGPDAASQQIG